MTTNGHRARGTLPNPGDRHRLQIRDGQAPATLEIREVAPGADRPVRGTLTYHPDQAAHPRHSKQPYACDLRTLDNLWRPR